MNYFYGEDDNLDDELKNTDGEDIGEEETSEEDTQQQQGSNSAVRKNLPNQSADQGAEREDNPEGDEGDEETVDDPTGGTDSTQETNPSELPEETESDSTDTDNPTQENKTPKRQEETENDTTNKRDGKSKKEKDTSDGNNRGKNPSKTDAKDALNNTANNAAEKATEEAGKEVSKKVAEEGVKKGAETAVTSGAGTTGSASLLAALGPILIWVVIIIVAIIIIVGIIMFFMTMPGMVMEKLNEFCTKLAQQVLGFYGADTTEMISDEEKYEVLNYLEEMGYDLKGFGFITKDADPDDADYDAKQGVIRNPDTGKIAEAYSDIIGTYLMSDNYVYTARNFNETGILAFFTGLIETKFPLAWGAIDHLIDEAAWGKGLLSLYIEKDDEIGVEGEEYDHFFLDDIFGTNLTRNNVEIDPASKTMEIRRGWGENYYSYNLDGWAGRYGMPLEFLLSVHISTMKPDLAYEMVTEFDTNVKILLRKIQDAGVESSYKIGEDKYVTFAEVEDVTQGYRSDGAWGLYAWLDRQVLGKNEAEALFSLGFDHIDGCECEFEGEELKNLSGKCKEHIKEIIKTLSEANEYNFKTYTPYIKSVTNHWFRDVYFVLSKSEMKDLNFINIDADYEAITNERWTLYEMYDEDEDSKEYGNYKLYKYDENEEDGIGELYENDFDGDGIKGTQEDANKEGIKVIKKVKTTAEDLETEGIITLASDDSWSAYEAKDVSKDEYKRVYPEESEDTIKGKIYYRETMSGTLTQKEDGIRGVTNAKIKDMFLNRYYFSYDGTTETANVIAELRKKIGMTGKNKYGEVDSSKLDKEVEYDDDGDVNTKTQTVKVKDYVSQVSLTQDSLAAFSMLENTHTLDADYIYKDFKELIVELGYFTKEELSDGRQKTLQWLIPDVGSYGYPVASLDKKENEFGTQLHSKEDYKANAKNTLAAALEAALKEEEIPENEITNNDGSTDVINANSGMTQEQEQFNQIAGIIKEETNNKTFVSLGSVGSSNTLLSLDEWWKELQNMFDIFKSEGWTYLLDHSCTTFEQARTSGKHTTDCSLMTSWALQMLGVLDEGQVFSSHLATGSGLTSDAVAQKMIDAGAEVIVVNQMITSYDEMQPGDILFFDGHVSIYCGEGYSNADGETVKGSCWDTGSTDGIQKGGPRDCSFALQGGSYPMLLNCIVRFNFGSGSSKGGSFEGFEGGEAVVSPVTGILLDYGTYEKTEDDLEEIAEISTDSEETTEATEKNRKNSDKKSEVDPVGYAKILVLNEEIANQLVTCSEDRKKELEKEGGTVGEGIVTVDNVLNADNPVEALEKLNIDEKALYGYSLFYENYKNAEIDGYVIYIDGFKCELPVASEDESTTQTGDNPTPTDENVTSTGIELSKEYFEQNAAKGSNDTSFIPCNYEDTKYEPDEVFNLMSDKIENQQKAKSEAKNIAAPLYSFEGYLGGELQDLLLIKEGTVIGTTMSNKELVESRGETYVAPPAEEEETTEVDNNDTTTETDDKTEVQGNYLRVIMRDLDDTVVENVEEYMKLDEEGGGSREGVYGELEAITESSTDAEKIRAAATYFVSEGFTVEAAMGILGNIIQECALDPAAVSATGGFSGLCQWDTNGRYVTVTNWMSEQGYNKDDFAGQIRAILESPDKSHMSDEKWEELKGLTDIEKAAELFAVYYEGCVGGTDPTVWYNAGTNYQHLNLRKQYSQNAYKIYMGDDSVGIKD